MICFQAMNIKNMKKKKLNFFFSLIYLSVSKDFSSNKIFVDCWDKINKSIRLKFGEMSNAMKGDDEAI